MYSIEILFDGKQDIFRIQNYIAQDSLYYSIEVLKSIQNSIGYLKDFPYLGVCINKDLRKLVNTKYTYSIFYKINEQNKIVKIVAITKNR